MSSFRLIIEYSNNPKLEEVVFDENIAKPTQKAFNPKIIKTKVI